MYRGCKFTSRLVCSILLGLTILLSARYAVFLYQRNLFTLTLTAIATAPPYTKYVPRSAGAILTLSYSDQQTAAGMGVASQQCWLRYFNQSMNIVEPFASHSFLVHNSEAWATLEPHSQRKQLRFSDYFDLANFNRQSGGKHLLEPWEQFITDGPRNVISVSINYAIPKRQCLSFKMECPALPEYPLETDNQNSFWTGCETDHVMQEALDFLRQKGFKVVREICLNCAAFKPRCGVPASITAEDVHRKIFQQFDSTKLTVVFNEWYYRFNFRTGCSTVHSDCLSLTNSAHRLLVPSFALEQKAAQYIQSALKTKGLVAVLLRLEWILAYSDATPHEAKRCVLNALNDAKMFRAKFSSSAPFIVTDLGRYGSHTFNKTLGKARLQVAEDMTKYVRSKISDLYDRDWTYDQGEKELLDAAGGIEDSGYIAQLQRTIASQADCLVLVGGGNFQELALAYFIEKHKNLKDKCVSVWCAGEKAATFKTMMLS